MDSEDVQMKDVETVAQDVAAAIEGSKNDEPIVGDKHEGHETSQQDDAQENAENEQHDMKVEFEKGVDSLTIESVTENLTKSGMGEQTVTQKDEDCSGNDDGTVSSSNELKLESEDQMLENAEVGTKADFTVGNIPGLPVEDSSEGKKDGFSDETIEAGNKSFAKGIHGDQSDAVVAACNNEMTTDGLVDSDGNFETIPKVDDAKEDSETERHDMQLESDKGADYVGIEIGSGDSAICNMEYPMVIEKEVECLGTERGAGDSSNTQLESHSQVLTQTAEVQTAPDYTENQSPDFPVEESCDGTKDIETAPKDVDSREDIKNDQLDAVVESVNEVVCSGTEKGTPENLTAVTMEQQRIIERQVDSTENVSGNSCRPQDPVVEFVNEVVCSGAEEGTPENFVTMEQQRIIERQVDSTENVSDNSCKPQDPELENQMATQISEVQMNPDCVEKETPELPTDWYEGKKDELSDNLNKHSEKEVASGIFDDNGAAAAASCSRMVLATNEDGNTNPSPVIPRVTRSSTRAKDRSANKTKWMDKMAEGDGSGTPEEQAAFLKELESFYRERLMDLKIPKFYGQHINLLKLWRAVLKFGGYDVVTGSQLWRPVGESFHPPKSCTAISFTFRTFYEKALLAYERYKTQSGELELPPADINVPLRADDKVYACQTSGSGTVQRGATVHAMQGSYSQRGAYGEERNVNKASRPEKSIKSSGLLKHKRPAEEDCSVKAPRTETSRRLVIRVLDVGPPANWVKVNVQETEDAYEIYALVPGLLREEVLVQSEAAGRVVITGEPEHPDNPWGITPFQKVIIFPARIDPHLTTANLSFHGRLVIRAPFEQ